MSYFVVSNVPANDLFVVLVYVQDQHIKGYYYS